MPVTIFVTTSKAKQYETECNERLTSLVQTLGCGIFIKGEITEVWNKL